MPVNRTRKGKHLSEHIEVEVTIPLNRQPTADEKAALSEAMQSTMARCDQDWLAAQEGLASEWLDKPEATNPATEWQEAATWYARKIVGLATATRHLIAAGADSWSIFDVGVKIGMTVQRLQLDAEFGKPLGRGINQTARLDETRDSSNRKRSELARIKHKRWIDAAGDIWSRNDHLSVWACANHVRTALSLEEKQKTVADAIRMSHPKKLGEAG